MNLKSGKRIFRELSRKKFQPEHVAEVGVYLPDASNVYDYILQNVRCTLVEPDPQCVSRIRERFAGRNNVTLHPVAIDDRKGELELAQRGASTFAAKLSVSPTVVNDEYRLSRDDIFTVTAVTFDEIDDGTIDLLSVDIEGGEWFVIKHLVSRPTVISLETHGARYLNPYLAQIREWMRSEGYRTWYKDRADTVFIKDGALSVGLWDRLRLAWMETYLPAWRFRKNVKRALLGRKAKRNDPAR